MDCDLTEKKNEINDDKVYWWFTGHGWRRVDSLYLGISYTKNGYHLYYADMYSAKIDNGKWSFDPDYMRIELPGWALREGDNPVLKVLAHDRFTAGELFIAIELQRILLMLDRMENA